VSMALRDVTNLSELAFDQNLFTSILLVALSLWLLKS